MQYVYSSNYDNDSQAGQVIKPGKRPDINGIDVVRRQVPAIIIIMRYYVSRCALSIDENCSHMFAAFHVITQMHGRT